ncbi:MULTISPECIES: AMP-binding protein [Archaeoglobus]|jgi:acyl-CoA synthetase (AMP-forming)/AMP-acid ligase II|uniref:Long-chain-fatty-acid--CoA ligase (FadD-1) n=5 Tax=Archaeoglobus fulgidus TaxID=2234 RepID=O30147_ARCFU|nr:MULTISPECIES: AMP-binding protein [Archaeoglobus]AAB91140.1 long-chain-fatty-acid--CoA ligase (fadD-1) [Archaeoglobus fulgidus DSM 4304]AIG96928.1 Acyl-CoA synthetase (AMP-forming)/AMP-acid ligase II [Archaeoglobus fulgidus DSM 8774]KUJ94632.1 MAG: Long-chain-fatty-acid--CoA ligase (FadD-1) [Archaeoglobus fulgidus]MDI3497113.1 hypothetical protein [Archaeoglobus sp.]
MELKYKIGFPSLYYPKISLADRIDAAAEKFGEKTAIISAEPKFPSEFPESMNFLEICEVTKKLASGISRKGVRKGEHVGVCIPNSIDYVMTIYALWRVAATPVPINPMYKSFELEHILNDSEATTLVVHSMLYENFKPVLEKTGVERVFVVGGEVNSLSEVMDSGSEDFENVKVNPEEDVALIPYTGGTTGMPKGVMLTHFNLAANALQLAVATGLSHMDTIVGCMPMFHSAEFGLVNLMVTVGNEYVVMGMFNQEMLAENIEKYKGTFSWAVPPALNVLVNTLESSNKTYDWSYLKVFATGAWPVAPALVEKLLKLAAEKCNNPRLRHNQIWGMTEACPMVTTNPPLRLDKSTTQGVPMSDIELKVISLEDGRELGVGESGEIVIRGPNIFKGYWKREKENQECWWYDEKGRKFFRTGDVGFIDEEGFLHFQDRVKEVIKYKGYTIAPFELEALLMKHEAVMDVAVIGKPDEEAGEVPKAFIVLKPEYRGKVDEEDIIEWVRERISGYKRVREVEFVEELPRTASGKLLRRLLREKEAEKG